MDRLPPILSRHVSRAHRNTNPKKGSLNRSYFFSPTQPQDDDQEGAARSTTGKARSRQKSGPREPNARMGSSDNDNWFLDCPLIDDNPNAGAHFAADNGGFYWDGRGLEPVSNTRYSNIRSIGNTNRSFATSLRKIKPLFLFIACINEFIFLKKKINFLHDFKIVVIRACSICILGANGLFFLLLSSSSLASAASPKRNTCVIYLIIYFETSRNYRPGLTIFSFY